MRDVRARDERSNFGRTTEAVILSVFEASH